MASASAKPESNGIPPYTTTPVDHIPVVRRHWQADTHSLLRTTTIQVYAGLKNAFRTGRTKSIQFRRQQLLSLAYLVKDNIALFQKALASDLGRSDIESIV